MWPHILIRPNNGDFRVKSSVLNKLRRRKRRILRRIENRPGPERERPMIAASKIHYELGDRRFRAGWPQGIAPLGLPQIRTCPFRHTAPHIMNALRDGTLSGSQPVVGADTVPASGRIDPREWSPYGV